MAKTSCKKGQYYCNTDKKCKPIPRGFTVREDGFLVREGWSARYKKSIDCDNPKGFSQKAHCAGKKKRGIEEESNPRIPRKKGQPAKSKKHSDLYTDEDPKGTIHGLGFKDVATAKASVAKIRKSSRSHAHKIQAAIAMEQRARVMGKTAEAAVFRKFINSMKKKTKAMNEEKHGDHEYEMIRRQTDNIMVAAKKIKKKVGEGEGEVKAWVQSKITKASDYLDTAADYMTDKEEVKEGTLHKWFKGSKSKDGKGGWVNVLTGGTCASDEPGEGVPKCVSRAKYERMTPAERRSAARRKKAADPGQQEKTGAAKPTYVSTDKPKKKKKKKKTMKDETEFTSLPLVLEIPQSAGEFKCGLMFRESLELDRGMLFIFESNDYHTFHMKNTFIPLDIAFIKEDGTIDSIKELDPMSPIPVSPDSEIRYAVEVNRGWFAENDVNVGDTLLEEEDLTEGKDKKGKGSGTKDACYYKVKSRYSVWPSAYASGALVKCRKVGAANWGNKSEELEVSGDNLIEKVFDGKAEPEYNRDKKNKVIEKKPPVKAPIRDHYSWRDSFDLEEMTIAQRNSQQNQNKVAAQNRAKEMAKERIGSGTAKNPDTTIAQAKADNQASMRANAAAKNQQFQQDRGRTPAPTQGKPMPSNPQGMRQQSVGGQQQTKKPGFLDRVKNRLGQVKQGIGKVASGVKRVVGGAVDAATGNRTDLDGLGGERRGINQRVSRSRQNMAGKASGGGAQQQQQQQSSGGGQQQQKMGRTEVANRERLGNERVDQLKQKNQEFQAAKKSGNLKQFRADNPKLSGKERAQQMAKDRIAAKNNQNNQSGGGGRPQQQQQGSTATLTSSAGSLQKNKQKANRVANAMNKQGANVSVGKIDDF